MAYLNRYTFPFLFFLIIACSEDDTARVPSKPSKNSWIIDSTKVIGEFTNLFPLVQNPDYKKLSAMQELNSSERVLILKFNENVYVFPIAHLWVEVVNDEFDGTPVVITYCPITESGIAWNRIIDRDTLVFRASGMLYNENLMPADTARMSIWSQMRIASVYGDFLFDIPKTYQLIETTVRTARIIAPDAMVMLALNQKSAGINLSAFAHYSPDKNYFGVLEPAFAIKPELSVNLFKLTDFAKDVFIHSHKNYLIVGSKQHNIITAFIKESGRSYELISNDFPNILLDNRGNVYDIFGSVTRGPETGIRLNSPPAYLAQLWAWELFFDNIAHHN